MPEALVGYVSHYYGGINVMIVDTLGPIKKGQTLRVIGNSTDFEILVDSMQYNHEDIEKSEAGKQVGIKTPQRVRDGDEVYIIS